MRAIVLTMAFLWGVGQNTPFEWLYLYGVGPGDLLFLAMLALIARDPQLRSLFLDEAVRLRNLLYLVLAFVALTGVSSLVNVGTWGVNAKDIVEIFRPLYYFVLVVFVAVESRRHGDAVLIAFLAGILVSGVIAYMEPSHDNVIGLAVLWNPNVMGNILAVGIVMVSMLLVRGRVLVASVFLFAFLVLSVFTYSKGTWLMALMGFAACMLATTLNDDARTKAFGKVVLVVSVTGLVTLAVVFFDVLYQLVTFKLLTTQLDSSAAEGGTAAARWGFVLASVRLAAENPFFGVGISNYEVAYSSLADWLGSNFWATDNPHSAWLYILACIGVPALVVFTTIVYNVLQRYRNALPARGAAAFAYIGLIAGIFFLSGSVILHILTQYFFWFFAGVVYGLRPATEVSLRVVH